MKLSQHLVKLIEGISRAEAQYSLIMAKWSCDVLLSCDVTFGDTEVQVLSKRSLYFQTKFLNSKD